MTEKVEYTLLKVKEELIATNCACPYNVYSFFHTEQKYVLVAAQNEILTSHKSERLTKLNGKNLFVNKNDLPISAPSAETAPARKDPSALIAQIDKATAFNREVLGDVAAKALQNVYSELLTPTPGTASNASAAVAKLSDEILALVAPETGDLKTAVLKNARNIHLMHHAAAITTLAIMIAIANDFKSKTAFQQISQAILLMDASLAQLDPSELDTYYRARIELPSHIRDKINLHPVKSQQMASNLPLINDTINQIILLHHELHNGKGYHRGIHTGSAIALGRIVAFAVDLYELIKGYELRGSSISIKDALLYFEEKNVEPHLRRHSTKIVTSTYTFLGLK